MAYIELILLILILVFCFYKWATSTNNFFCNLGIPYEKPYPIAGSFPGVFLKTESAFDSVLRYYAKYKDQKFDHFMNHISFIEPEDDLLFGNSLFALKGKKWKDMRSTLSPAFTGSKMRLMFQLLTECCDEAIKVLNIKTKENANGYDLDMKDFFTRYTNDVIASSAFGLKINSISGENSEFYEMGKKVTAFGTIFSIKMVLIANFKQIMRFFKIKLFDPKSTDYFMRLVLDTMKYRTEDDIRRPDMIDILMESRKSIVKSHNSEWTDEEIVAQCFLFFFAGFAATSTLLCFTAHELLENPECQDKMYEEIKQVKKELDGKPLSYEALQGMKYMDMVVSEALRKWPPVITADRQCTKAYQIKTDDNIIDIKPGNTIWIPVAGLHYDPKFFPDPRKFDPERFSEENKKNIVTFSYCPFGFGPRICLGSKLALMEAKAILFYMLSEFKFCASERTGIPLKLDTTGFQLKPKGGFWLKLVSRK